MGTRPSVSWIWTHPQRWRTIARRDRSRPWVEHLYRRWLIDSRGETSLREDAAEGRQ